MAERPISTLNKPDVVLELTLRPSVFSDFTGQAKKRGVDLHLDTIRIKNIYNRVRLNVDGWIETFRYPRNILLPVQAIRFEVTPRYGRVRKFTIAQPMLGRLLRIYNHLAQVTPPVT